MVWYVEINDYFKGQIYVKLYYCLVLTNEHEWHCGSTVDMVYEDGDGIHHNCYDSHCGNLNKSKINRKMGGIPTMSQSHFRFTHATNEPYVVSIRHLSFTDRLKFIWAKFSCKAHDNTHVVTEKLKHMVGLQRIVY